MNPNRYFVDKSNPLLKVLKDDQQTDFGNGVLTRMRLTPNEWKLAPDLTAVSHAQVGTLTIDFDSGRLFHSPLDLGTFVAGEWIDGARQRMLTMADSKEIIEEIAVLATRGLDAKDTIQPLGQNNQTITGAQIQAQQAAAAAAQAALQKQAGVTSGLLPRSTMYQDFLRELDYARKNGGISQAQYEDYMRQYTLYTANPSMLDPSLPSDAMDALRYMASKPAKLSPERF